MNANLSVLVPSRERGWWMGLRSMLAKEQVAWWRTRRWWLQCLLWLALLNGTNAMSMQGNFDAASVVVSFLMMAGAAVPIAAISMAQDAILGERHSGTAAWVLSKPLRRPAYVMAKLIANGLGLLATGVVFPGVVAYFQLTSNGMPELTPLGFAGAMAMVYLNLLFYLTFALMLATLFNGRGPVLGITLGLLLGPPFVLLTDPNRIPSWLVSVAPWRLLTPIGNNLPLAGYPVMGVPLPTLVPIVATAVWCVLFVGVAIWRVCREEF